MSEKSKSVTANNWADYLIGYERVLDYLKDAQKKCPKGVGLKKEVKSSGSYICLRFQLGDKRTQNSCGCSLTMQGISDALKKAHLVATALESLSSETEFWSWYDDVILEKNVVRNDLITFGEAIAKVEAGYWDGVDRKLKPRDRKNISQVASWDRAYGDFYKLLPPATIVNLADLLAALATKEKGSKQFGFTLFAFQKLAATIKDEYILKGLEDINHVQTKFRKRQNADLVKMLEWFKQALNNALPRYADSRKRWLWVLAMQMVYGFRVHEVFAICNIREPFVTDDGVTIPALNDPKNKKMIAVVGDKTTLDTTTKTGYRLSAPMLPPSHPDLIEVLDLRNGNLPLLRVQKLSSPKHIISKYGDAARDRMKDWNCPITHTHALRHLCNHNGKQAGINIEDRAANLGHSIAMNESVYAKHQATNTRLATIDSMTSRRQLPLEGALQALVRIGIMPETLALVSEIYGLQIDDLLSLVRP